MKKVIAVLAIVVLMTGCAGFGQFSDAAKAKLLVFQTWADEWIGGALKVAPTVIAGVVSLTGESTETQMASQALVAAQSALSSYKAIVAVGSTADATAQQTAVLGAIEDVKKTVGAIEKTVQLADPTLSSGTLSDGTVNLTFQQVTPWTTAATLSVN